MLILNDGFEWKCAFLEHQNSLAFEEVAASAPVATIKSTSSLPKREMNGLTFTQNVGVFPRQVSLEIRHAHPTLGLNEVAHQRQHHENQSGFQCYQNLDPPVKGVLSLGLPPSMIPRGFQSVKKQSATSEAIHHYYETLSPKYANVMKQQSLQRV